MKKVLVTMMAALTMVGFVAQADDNKLEAPLWECALTFSAQGGGLQIILGKFELSGPGKVSCVDIAGNTQVMKVKVTLGGDTLAPNVAFGRFKVAGVATGIGLASNPEALLGKYYTASAHGALLAGAGANFAVHGRNEAVTMNVGISLAKGAGLQLGINKMRIKAVRE
jgi:hypothetical protein